LKIRKALTTKGTKVAQRNPKGQFDPGVTHAKSFVFGVTGGRPPAQIAEIADIAT